jgi:hypothetical protein
MADQPTKPIPLVDAEKFTAVATALLRPKDNHSPKPKPKS